MLLKQMNEGVKCLLTSTMRLTPLDPVDLSGCEDVVPDHKKCLVRLRGADATGPHCSRELELEASLVCSVL